MEKQTSMKLTKLNRKITQGLILFTALSLSCVKRASQVKVNTFEEKNPNSVEQEGAPVNYFNQGWTTNQRDWFYNTSQGSQIIPYDWFLALESHEDDTLFRSEKSMARSGYLASPVSNLNPDGLPVGFAKDVDEKRGTFVGLTCAGCHTGQLHYQGKKYQVDGGVGMGDIMKLVELIHASLKATLDQPEKFDRFQQRVQSRQSGAYPSAALQAASQQPAGLRRALETRRDELVAFLERSTPSSPAGSSRVPHFGLLINEGTGTALGIKENKITTNAFTTIPMLWGFTELDWVGANASVNNPVARMCLEAMGVMAYFKLIDPANLTFESSFRLADMYGMHEASSKLKAPRWNEDVFGAIDRNSASLGEKIYASQCQECHALESNLPKTEVNKFGKSFVKVNIVDLAEIGTDPTLVQEMLSIKSQTSFLAPYLQNQKEVLGLELTRFAIGAFLRGEFAKLKLTPDTIIAYTGHRDSKVTQPRLNTYKARQLDGIWATAPFLHHGAVPTLHELLKKPEERIKEFWIGNYEFDAQNVGISTIKSANSTYFDTNRIGNGNMGHTYGTDLSKADKNALLEFLKTL